MRAYRALLRGDCLEWRGEAPESRTDAPLSVQVIILDEEPLSEGHARGPSMAALLENLAERNTFLLSQTLSGGSANPAKIVYCRGATGDACR
jgi:hypothetical protein